MSEWTDTERQLLARAYAQGWHLFSDFRNGADEYFWHHDDEGDMVDMRQEGSTRRGALRVAARIVGDLGPYE